MLSSLGALVPACDNVWWDDVLHHLPKIFPCNNEFVFVLTSTGITAELTIRLSLGVQEPFEEGLRSKKHTPYIVSPAENNILCLAQLD